MPQWSKEEDEILIDKYPDTSQEKLIDLLPNHSWNAIKVRAHQKFGLRRSKAQFAKDRGLEPWSEEEVEILGGVYPVKYTDEIKEALPSRTWSAIETKAQELKLHRKVDRCFGPVKKLDLEDVDSAYIASMVDGEGTVCLFVGSRGYVIPITSIANNALDMLRWIQEVIGMGRLYKSKESRTWKLTISGNSNQIAFLEAILPYLKIKHRQAKLVLEFLRARRKRRRVPIFDEQGKSRGTKIIRDPREQRIYEEYLSLNESRSLC